MGKVNYKEIREILGYTQEQWSRLLKVTQPTVSYWEKGRSSPSKKNKAEMFKFLSKDRA